MKAAVFDILGRECIRCGINDTRVLQIDHINGGGRKERTELKLNYYKFVLGKLLEENTDYQVLCANCNWIKRSENNEHRK